MSQLGKLINRGLLSKQNFIIAHNIYSSKYLRRAFNVKKKSNSFLKSSAWILSGTITAIGGVCFAKMFVEDLKAESLRKKMQQTEEVLKLTARERRFIKFASCEYDDQIYMTPQDFLDSVVETEPRPRLKRRNLTTSEIEAFKNETPSITSGSQKLFRVRRDRGIISYTEYLFLLSILTKPQSGFRIAFNMFDTDGNQKVDKDEFLVILAILCSSFKRNPNVDEATRKIQRRLIPFDGNEKIDDAPKSKQTGTMERIFSSAWKEKYGEKKNPQTEDKTYDPKKDSNGNEFANDHEGLQRRHMVDTFLQVHFFGPKGNGVMSYDFFYKFMDNLQTEVLELEFNEFSKGQTIISEIDFARILLRYTYLQTDEYDIFLERLLERCKDRLTGITFDDFRDFCRFLNHLDDFTIAMRMYTLADRSISEEEFSRAVKICTGYTLSPHLVRTVFAIFDADGDGMLSYKEFIAIMKDRLHRGFKVSDRFFDNVEDLELPELAMFSNWRKRVCRRLDNFMDNDALFH